MSEPLLTTGYLTSVDAVVGGVDNVVDTEAVPRFPTVTTVVAGVFCAPLAVQVCTDVGGTGPEVTTPVVGVVETVAVVTDPAKSGSVSGAGSGSAAMSSGASAGSTTVGEPPEASILGPTLMVPVPEIRFRVTPPFDEPPVVPHPVRVQTKMTASKLAQN